MSAKVLTLVPAPVTERDAEHALVRRCAAGDTDALALLFEAHVEAVRRFVGRMLAGDPDVDDVVQETFLELSRCGGRFRGESAVRTWILGTAVNQCRRHLRYRGRLRRLRMALGAQPPRHLRNEPGDAENHLMLEHLARALAELPLRQREAFLLCDVEQVPCVDAAVHLGKPVGSVYRHLHEARKALRAALSGGK